MSANIRPPARATGLFLPLPSIACPLLAGHLVFVTQAVDWFVPVATGKHEAAVAGYSLEFARYGMRLPRQRYNVLGFHLHASGGDEPRGVFQIKLNPLRAYQLTGTHEGLRQQLLGCLSPVSSCLAIARNRSGSSSGRTAD